MSMRETGNARSLRRWFRLASTFGRQSSYRRGDRVSRRFLRGVH
jgi:hypothetical protein